VLQFEAEILGNRPVAESWRELVLAWDARAGGPAPGQFFTFRAARSSDPLLRRPLAFSGFAAVAGGKAEARAIYQARGTATRILADLAPGATLDVIGPLGRPFPLPAEGEVPIVAGGGIGLGPLLFLDARLRAAGAEPKLALGFRSASYLPSVELPRGTVICTDDGSAGERGTPVDWISRNVPPAGEARAGTPPRLYACGPLPMLAALAALAAERSWPAWFSAEQWMACGVGACMGCALPRADGKGYLRACADGPVFAASEIAWGTER
jgi:dihydroorotate dehydrogenase electron transfer subunit